MTLPEKLLSKLACPKCRGTLNYDQNNNRLVCNACGLAYPIKDNVPVLLIDEAQKLQGKV